MITSTPVAIRFAGKTYSARIEFNAITVSRAGRTVLHERISAGGNAMAEAICELDGLQDQLQGALFSGQEMPHWGADELPLNVDIKNGEHSFRCNQAGAFHVVNARLDRHGEPWLDTDELTHKNFWVTLAGALHNTRRKLALLG